MMVRQERLLLIVELSKSFDDEAARVSYVVGAPNPVTAHLLAHSLSLRLNLGTGLMRLS
jgi:hypothetical protein